MKHVRTLETNGLIRTSRWVPASTERLPNA